MIANSGSWIEQASGHTVVVVVVGLCFCALQVLLCMRVLLNAALQSRTLKKLCAQLRQGYDGRCEVDEAPLRFGWLRWVLSEFPSATFAEIPPTTRFTRDDALHELDVRISGSPAYLMLQRMSVMAPLLGVVLTVLGFYWLDVEDASEQSLQGILAAVTPLVTGVGAGAVLALINQFLLQLAGGRLERLRIQAREWFDEAVWQDVGGRGQVAVDNAMADHAKIAQSFSALAGQFENIVTAFQADMEGIPQALNRTRQALEATSRALDELLPSAERSVANLDVSVAAFRTTIDREFHDAAKLHHRASVVLATAAEQIRQANDVSAPDMGDSTSTSIDDAASATSEQASQPDAAPRDPVRPR